MLRDPSRARRGGDDRRDRDPDGRSQPLRRHAGGRRGSAGRLPREAEGPRRPADTVLASMGIYIFDMKHLVPVLEADARRSTTHDFGKDIIPELVSQGDGLRLSLHRREQEGSEVLARHRHARRVLRREHGPLPRQSRTSTCTIRNGRCARIRCRRRRRSSSSPTRAGAAVRRSTRSSRPGCIISGSRISGSVLCPNVRVHSFCTVEQSILMPGVRVGRHARIRRAIIDRDVFIPRGALIGYNIEEDRQRHTVTESGIVVVTTDDEPFIGDDRRRRAAQRAGIRSARFGHVSTSASVR